METHIQYNCGRSYHAERINDTIQEYIRQARALSEKVRAGEAAYVEEVERVDRYKNDGKEGILIYYRRPYAFGFWFTDFHGGDFINMGFIHHGVEYICNSGYDNPNHLLISVMSCAKTGRACFANIEYGGVVVCRSCLCLAYQPLMAAGALSYDYKKIMHAIRAVLPQPIYEEIEEAGICV